MGNRLHGFCSDFLYNSATLVSCTTEGSWRGKTSANTAKFPTTDIHKYLVFKVTFFSISSELRILPDGGISVLFFCFFFMDIPKCDT